MAVYKFKVTFEDFDEVVREIEIRSNQTFADFHKAIHQSIGFNGDAPSSFYMSNDYWHKGKEITLKKGSVKNPDAVLMEDSFLKNFIEDPHQKIYYIFNFDRPWTFQIELIKITIQENPKITYPVCVKTIGEAPKQFGATVVPGSVVAENDDLDFLNQLELGDDDAEGVEDMGFDDESQEEESSDEFGGESEFDDEFSNSEE